MPLNEKQQDIINTFINDNLVFVSASAGTGKTTTLVHAYIKLLSIKEKIENIVVITFTKAAANEMLKRIRDEVRAILKNEDTEKGKLYWISVYNDLIVKSNITTIDAYVLSIIKDNALEISMPSNISIINEDSTFFDMLYENLEDILATSNYGSFLYSSYNLYIVDIRKTFLKNIVDFINKISTRFETIEAFRESVLSLTSFNIDYNALKENIILSLKKVVHFEYSSREPKTVSSIKSLISDFLLLIEKYSTFDYIENMDEKSFFNFYIKLSETANKALGNLKLDFKITYEEGREYLLELLKVAEKSYASKHIEALSSFMIDAYKQSESIKKRNGFYSYDDLLIKAIEALTNNELGNSIRSKIKTLILDEAQDTSELQFNFMYLLLADSELIKSNNGKLTKEIIKQLGKRLFIVGDRKQSIYRFRNTNIKSFLEAQISFNDNVRYLKDNYRSGEYLIEFFNDFFLNTVFKSDSINYIEDDNIISKKEVVSEYGEGRSVLYLRLNQKTEDSSKINADERYTLESLAIAKYINENYKDRIKDIAILLPVFSNIDKYLKALSIYNIPFYVESGSGFYDRKEIISIIYMLRYIVLHEESILSHLLISPLFDIKVNEIYEVINDLNAVNITLDDYFSLYKNETEEYLMSLDIISKKSFKKKIINIKNIIYLLQEKAFSLNSEQLIEEICRETNYYAYIMTESDNELAYANIENLKNIAKNYEHQTGKTIYDFVLHLLDKDNLKASLGSVPKLEIDSLRIMTIHKSKGLEFPITFVAALSSTKQTIRGNFNFIDDDIYFNIPVWHTKSKFFISNTTKDKDKELALSERKRLLYVALTRSSENLILSGDVNRTDAYIKYVYDYFNDIIEPNMFSEDTHLLEEDNTKICFYGRKLKEILAFEAGSFSVLDNINHLKEVYDNAPTKKNSLENTKIIYVRASSIYKIDTEYYKNNAVNSIKQLLDTKITYFEEHEGIIEEYDSEGLINKRISPINLGSILHTVFEHFDFDIYREKSDDYVDNLINKTLSSLKNYEDSYIRDAIKKAIDKFTLNTHIKGIIKREETLVSREQAFYKSFRGDDGNKHIMNGRIDLITKDSDDNYYIIDYKTVEYKEDIYRRYESQLNIYREFVKDFYNVEDDKLFTEILCLK